jgi:hypothetical protein
MLTSNQWGRGHEPVVVQGRTVLAVVVNITVFKRQGRRMASKYLRVEGPLQCDGEHGSL